MHMNALTRTCIHNTAPIACLQLLCYEQVMALQGIFARDTHNCIRPANLKCQVRKANGVREVLGFRGQGFCRFGLAIVNATLGLRVEG